MGTTNFKELYIKSKGKEPNDKEYLDYLESRLNAIRDIALKSTNERDSIYAIILLTEN